MAEQLLAEIFTSAPPAARRRTTQPRISQTGYVSRLPSRPTRSSAAPSPARAIFFGTAARASRRLGGAFVTLPAVQLAQEYGAYFQKRYERRARLKLKRPSRARKLRVSRAPPGRHGRAPLPSISRVASTDTRRVNAGAARATQAIVRAFQRNFGLSRTQATSVARKATVQAKAISPLVVKGKRLSTAKLDAAAARRLARDEARARAAAERAAAAARRAAERTAKAQARAFRAQDRQAQRALEHLQKQQARIDVRAQKAKDKLLKQIQRKQQADAKKAMREAQKLAKNRSLGEEAVDFIRKRLNLPNAATAIQVATGVIAPGAVPQAVAREEECREQDTRRRRRVSRQARCAGVPCGEEIEEPATGSGDNVVPFPRPKG